MYLIYLIYLYNILLLIILSESCIFYNSLVLSILKRKILNIPGICWKKNEHIRSKIYPSMFGHLFINLFTMHSFFDPRKIFHKFYICKSFFFQTINACICIHSSSDTILRGKCFLRMCKIKSPLYRLSV